MTGDGLYVFIQAIYSDFGHGLLLVPHDSYRETTSQNFRFWQEFRALERTSPTFRYLGIRAQSDEAMTAVQRQMKDHSDELWKLLQSQNSHLYISGKGLEEASSDWLMISKCIEFILIIYIYHHIPFILWENVIITVDFDVFSGRCWDNSGEFFQEVASAQQQNWIQLRRMMRQQGRYHCGWWPMVKLSRSKRCVARHGSLSAGDKRVEYQWIASRNQRWKWNSTRSEFRDYCPIFSMYIFLYFPIFSYMFLLRMVFSMGAGASFCHLFWQLCESMHGRCHSSLPWRLKRMQTVYQNPQAMGRLSAIMEDTWFTEFMNKL